MSTKPILFSTQNVRAILAGRKTVTRRAVKPQPCEIANDRTVFEDDGVYFVAGKADSGEMAQYVLPYQPGDVLYVRETWIKLYYVDPNGYTHYDQPMYYYAADGTPDITLCDADGFEEDNQRIHWRPSIHMPKEAARIFLRVTDVRVERLQDITTEQIKAEGVSENDITERDAINQEAAAKWLYKALWDSTIKRADHGLYGWAANPWVWVIKFERTSKAVSGDA